MNTQPSISGRRGRRIFMAIGLLGIASLVDIECAKATSVKACEPASPARTDKARVEGLAKNLVAPKLLDEARNSYCKQGAMTIAFFQTPPVLAADGAFETEFTICRRDRRWKCELFRERAIDVVEAADSATVRITTRDDLSVDQLRELYSAALKLAGSDSTIDSPDCHTRADQAERLRAMFLQSQSRTTNISREGTLFDVERDHIEINFSIEEDANGVKTMQYRCIVQWPTGDRDR